jgi:hypothetical protein
MFTSSYLLRVVFLSFPPEEWLKIPPKEVTGLMEEALQAFSDSSYFTIIFM